MTPRPFFDSYEIYESESEKRFWAAQFEAAARQHARRMKEDPEYAATMRAFPRAAGTCAARYIDGIFLPLLYPERFTADP